MPIYYSQRSPDNSVQALSTKPAWLTLPPSPEAQIGTYHTPQEPVHFPTADNDSIWRGVDAQSAIMSLISSVNVQRATGIDQQGLLRRLGAHWTADSALLDGKPSAVFIASVSLIRASSCREILINVVVER